MIRYVSTRGQAPTLSFEEVVLAGLASDGGLYVPDRVPQFSPAEITALAALPYSALAMRVMQPFVGNAIAESDLRALIENSYAGFRHPAIAPLKQLGAHDFLLELFHGPTLAFKDFALQFLGRTLEYFLIRSGAQLTVVGATSGDTGSAAIEGCRGRKNMHLFILHPKGRVSEVQRRQMTTVEDANVFNIALEGTFDDCQDIVKALFADAAFRSKHTLAAVNSINWARILAQVVYYFYAALALGAPARQVSFCVPTGNFGDIYAGYIAKAMGLPIAQLIIATNQNDILARCLDTGVYGMQAVTPSLSPSMDIQISSNFERLLFDLYDRDGAAIGTMMQQFRTTRSLTLSPQVHGRLTAAFAAGRADDSETQATIAAVFQETGELLDPHTAVGIAVARKLGYENALLEGVPVVTLATAHPAKFPDAVLKASGIHPPLPPHLAHLMEGKERMTVLPNDEQAIKTFIESSL
jgi:threonine synthase